jgi:hypothetical protein
MKYWMVHRSAGSGYPTNQVHETVYSAVQEAKRLAQLFPGETFYVLEAVGCAKTVAPVEYQRFEDLPF